MTKKQKIENYKILLKELQYDYDNSKHNHNLMGYCHIYDRLRIFQKIKTVKFDHDLDIEENMIKTFQELEKYRPSDKTITKYSGWWFDPIKGNKNDKRRIKIVEKIIKELENETN